MNKQVVVSVLMLLTASAVKASDSVAGRLKLIETPGGQKIELLKKYAAPPFDKTAKFICNSYGLFRSTCVNSTLLARSPVIQKYMQENFGMIISTVLAVAAIVGWRGMMLKKQRDARLANKAATGPQQNEAALQLQQQTDSAFLQNYTNIRERALDIIHDALLNYNSELLKVYKGYDESDEVCAALAQQISGDGIVTPVSVHGYSQPVLQVVLKGSQTEPLSLTIQNNLEERPVAFTFVTPFKQDDLDRTGLARLVGHNNDLASMSNDLIAPYLAWVPGKGESKNTQICLQLATLVDTSNTVPVVQKLPDELDFGATLEWIGLKRSEYQQRALIWPRPTTPNTLDAPAIFDVLAGFLGDYILLNRPGSKYRNFLVNVDIKPAQVVALGIKKVNKPSSSSSTLDDVADRSILVAANGVIGDYLLESVQEDSQAQAVNGLFAYDQLSDRGTRAKIIAGIAAVHAASTESRFDANIVGKMHNGTVDYRILRADGMQLWPIVGSSNASSSNAHEIPEPRGGRAHARQKHSRSMSPPSVRNTEPLHVSLKHADDFFHAARIGWNPI